MKEASCVGEPAHLVESGEGAKALRKRFSSNLLPNSKFSFHRLLASSVKNDITTRLSPKREGTQHVSYFYPNFRLCPLPIKFRVLDSNAIVFFTSHNKT